MIWAIHEDEYRHGQYTHNANETSICVLPFKYFWKDIKKRISCRNSTSDAQLSRMASLDSQNPQVSLKT